MVIKWGSIYAYFPRSYIEIHVWLHFTFKDYDQYHLIPLIFSDLIHRLSGKPTINPANSETLFYVKRKDKSKDYFLFYIFPLNSPEVIVKKTYNYNTIYNIQWFSCFSNNISMMWYKYCLSVQSCKTNRFRNNLVVSKSMFLFKRIASTNHIHS